LKLTTQLLDLFCVLQAAAFMVFLLPGLLLMNAAIIKHTTTATGNAAGAASTAAATELDAEAASEPGTEAAASDRLEAPLLLPARISKKAGFRDAGLVFTPRKSWWAGLLLVVVAGVVMAITCLTAGS
jgi:sodium-coupled neutral amino acid transporter 7/8